MCGIAGYIDFTSTSTRDTLAGMADALSHRGPDDSGYEHFDGQKAQVGLGFRRLSIIELSPLGHQPMFSADRQLTLVFNGEIYNYREIRKELESMGVSFRSNSDTEVIMHSYRQWGKECVKKFIGMFAISIYDTKNNKVFFARDRAGVKPLYYYWQNGLFLFASELKSFHRHPRFVKEIDFDALALYFCHGYIPAPYSIFKNTFKLLPGHILELDLAKKSFAITKYWDVNEFYNQPKLDISFEEAAEETERLMLSAFQYRMIADVPVGVFLSGGYDSSAVTALLQANSSRKIKTFTIGFHEDEFNEAHYAKEVAQHLGTGHHEHYCTFKEAMDIIPRLPFIYDEPFGDSSALPTTLVSMVARKYVTVALSADAGDEIFAGYPKYIKGTKYYSILEKIPTLFTKAAGGLMKALPLNPTGNLAFADRYEKLAGVLLNREPVYAFNTVTQAMTPSEAARLIAKPVKYLETAFDEGNLLNNYNDPLQKFMATEFRTYLVDDILHKVDRATMSVSLEGREPFLDHRIIEFVSRLPSGYKLVNGKGKVLLRKIVHKYIPEKIMERPKMGFGVPVSLWCKNELKDLFLHYLDDDTMRKQGIFDVKQTILMKKKYLENKRVDFPRIWFLLMFQMWHEQWMNK